MWRMLSLMVAFIWCGLCVRLIVPVEDLDVASRDTEARFTVPAPTREQRWVRIIDTGRPAPADFVDPERADTVECGAMVLVRSMGCVVLQSMVKEAKR